MDDFRKFMQSGGAKNDKEKSSAEKGSSQTNPFNKDGSRKGQLEYIQDLAKYYNEHGEEKLLEDIFKNVSQQKEQGNITNDEILRMSKGISAMLDPTQKARLEELVKKLTN